MKSQEPNSDDESLPKTESEVDEEDDELEIQSEDEDISENSDDDTEDVPIVNSTSFINDESDESDEDENYLQKFDEELTHNYIVNNHQEDLAQNYSEILTLSKIVKDDDGNIIDLFHKTSPILTKYEKTRILGLRTKQLNDGAPPLIKLSENIIDSYIIAEMELKEKKIPFIIQRPLPNGNAEYWALEDLEIL